MVCAIEIFDGWCDLNKDLTDGVEMEDSLGTAVKMSETL